MVYVHEIHAIDRGGKERFLRWLQEDWAPFLARTRGVRLLWTGSTIGSTGRWPETMVVWELDDWRHYADYCVGLDPERGGDSEWRERWQAGTALRVRSRSRTLVPAPGSPTREQLLADGVCGTIFVFADYRFRPGARADFFAALERQAGVDAARGRALVGACEVAFTRGEAAAIWAHSTIDDLTAFEHARAPEAWASLIETRDERWAFATPGSPLWPAGERNDVPIW